MRRNHARVLLCATLAAVLGGCAMGGSARQPALAPEPASREDGPHKKIDIAEPQTIVAWEARIQSHAATLHALLHRSAGGGATPAGPRPRAHRYRPGSAHPSPRATRGATASRRSIRCRRICRHVRAICYAAKRICQIAARVGGESARAACKRNQNRCQSARDVTTRRGCTGCGH